MHSFEAESDVELNLLVGDHVVIRKVFTLDSTLMDTLIHTFGIQG